MSEVLHITSSGHLGAVFKSTTYVVVDFYAVWCGPCKAVAPMYENLAKNHGIEGVLAFCKVNVDDVQDVARQYGVSAMPTFMFFKDGRQVAVNGNSLIRGADVGALTAAAVKLSGLAKAKAGSA